eukprot:g37054.t1
MVLDTIMKFRLLAIGPGKYGEVLLPSTEHACLELLQVRSEQGWKEEFVEAEFPTSSLPWVWDGKKECSQKIQLVKKFTLTELKRDIEKGIHWACYTMSSSGIYLIEHKPPEWAVWKNKNHEDFEGKPLSDQGKAGVLQAIKKLVFMRLGVQSPVRLVPVVVENAATTPSVQDQLPACAIMLHKYSVWSEASNSEDASDFPVLVGHTSVSPLLPNSSGIVA